MENIQIFNNPEFGEIRTIIIDGEPWFVGRDVAAKLGYLKPENAISKWCDSEDTLKWGIPSNGGEQKTLIINESGLYSLIFGSKLESTKRFKHWVTSEVLPSIHRTGTYGQVKSTREQIVLLAKGTSELYERVGGLEDKFAKFEQDLPLFPEDADKIKNALNKKVVEYLGGKNSVAYHNRSICRKAFIDAYRELKRNFEVSSYKSIKRNQKKQALEVIAAYHPPVVLMNEIELANSQISLPLEGGAC
jgi:prophage antirepressor-like protein